jgi:hypothetical protein
MSRVDDIKARLNRLVDISESGQMNRDVIAQFLAEGPEDILYLLSRLEQYQDVLQRISKTTSHQEALLLAEEDVQDAMPTKHK